MTLDGRITRPFGEGSAISNTQSRLDIHDLRSEVDAIITSGETLRQDNPALTLRPTHPNPLKEQPYRVVMTQNGPSEVLRKLAKDYQSNTILLECGGKLMGAFLDEHLIDEIIVYLAPLVTGGPNLSLTGNSLQKLSDRFQIDAPEITRIGDDIRIRGLVKKNRRAD